MKILLTAFLIAVLMQSAALAETARFRINGALENPELNEASGLQAGEGGVFFVHNDEKNRLYVIDETGRHLGAFRLDGAKNRDWEDLARVPGPDGPLLVVADVGDNRARRKDVDLYFLPEPGPGQYAGEYEPVHRLQLRYPDGPRDVESVAYDPSSQSILLLSKRDVPPRLYGVALDRALSEKKLEVEFLAQVPGFRPPTKADVLSNPMRGMWVSQPTGMDISPDGRTAAVITYRSLYLFRREENESWAQAFQNQPVEYLGPPGTHDEAVAFSRGGKSVYVTTERRPAPVYKLEVPELP